MEPCGRATGKRGQGGRRSVSPRDDASGADRRQRGGRRRPSKTRRQRAAVPPLNDSACVELPSSSAMVTPDDGALAARQRGSLVSPTALEVHTMQSFGTPVECGRIPTGPETISLQRNSSAAVPVPAVQQGGNSPTLPRTSSGQPPSFDRTHPQQTQCRPLARRSSGLANATPRTDDDAARKRTVGLRRSESGTDDDGSCPAGTYNGVAIVGAFSRRKRDSLQSSRSCEVSPRSSVPSRPPTTSPVQGTSPPRHSDDSEHEERLTDPVSPISIPRSGPVSHVPRGHEVLHRQGSITSLDVAMMPTPSTHFQPSPLVHHPNPLRDAVHIMSPEAPTSSLLPPVASPASPVPLPFPQPQALGKPWDDEGDPGEDAHADRVGHVSTAPTAAARPPPLEKRGRAASSTSEAFLGSTHASTHLVTPADFSATHASWVNVDSDDDERQPHGGGDDAGGSPALSTMSAEARAAHVGRGSIDGAPHTHEPGGSSLRVSDSPHTHRDGLAGGEDEREWGSDELEPKRLFDDESSVGQDRRLSRMADVSTAGPEGGSFCADHNDTQATQPCDSDAYAPAPPHDPHSSTASGFTRRVGSTHNTTNGSVVQPLNESIMEEGVERTDSGTPTPGHLTPYSNLYSAQDLQFEDYESDSDDDDVSVCVFAGATPSISLLAQKFKQNVFQKIVVVLGPYASVPPRVLASDPPNLADAKLLTLELDRVRSTDVADLLASMGVAKLRDAFDENFYRAQPGVLCNVWREYWPTNSAKEILLAHVLCKLLHERDLLMRAYTPSLDGLLRVVGCPRGKVVEVGGTFSASRCIDCGKEHMSTYMKEKLFRHQRPTCTFKPCKGLVKPDVQFTNQKHPTPHVQIVDADLEDCDLLIAVGMARHSDHPQHAVLERIVDGVPDTVPRLFIRPARETERDAPPDGANATLPVGAGGAENYRDVFIDTTTERGVAEFSKYAGLEFSMRKILPQHIAKRYDALMTDLDNVGIVRSAPKVKSGLLKATVFSRVARQIPDIAGKARPTKSPLARAHPKKTPTPKSQSPSKLGLVSDFNRTICRTTSHATPGRSSSAGNGQVGNTRNLRPEPSGLFSPSRGTPSLKPLSAPPGSTFVHQARVRFNTVVHLVDDEAGTVEHVTLDGIPYAPGPAPASATPVGAPHTPEHVLAAVDLPEALTLRDPHATPQTNIPRPPKHPRRTSKE